MNISRFIRTAVTAISILATSAASASMVYQTGSSDPWNNTTNDAAMSTAFGAGIWTKSNGFSIAQLTGASFVFLDGSDSSANEFSSFLATNMTQIQNYVFGGGHLFLNAAPNVGGSFNIGFGVTLNYPDLSFNAQITAAGIAAGLTNGGIATSYTANAFGHATVSGAGVSNLISGIGGRTLFGAMQYGNGFVAFGGHTTANWHSPSPDGQTLLVNELLYVNRAPSATVPEPTTLALLALGFLGFGVTRRRKQ